jgi:hypothetical protein
MQLARPAAAALVLLLGALPAAAQPAGRRAGIVEVDLRSGVFVEPSATSEMTVITPSAGLSAVPWEWLELSAEWEADIVSGASETVKAGPLLAGNPDIVSAASVVDERHVFGGSVGLRRGGTELSVGGSYGAERDYRSRALGVAAGTDFLQKNTRIELAYARGFDEVCDVQRPETLHPTLRPALPSSEGCFRSGGERVSRDVEIDTFQGAWTQAWTPILETQLVVTGSLQHGFLGNPYRAVVIGPTGQTAQEHHPDDRARVAAALRARVFVRPIRTAVGLEVRGYRDSWDVLGQTYALELEKSLWPWLRLRARGRHHRQTGALFWSDDYTGGEPLHGPRGQYWSGDRELSPLGSWLAGVRAVASARGRPGDRIVGILLDLEAGLGVDALWTELEDFTWAGRTPDDTTAYVGTLSVTAGF